MPLALISPPCCPPCSVPMPDACLMPPPCLIYCCWFLFCADARFIFWCPWKDAARAAAHARLRARSEPARGAQSDAQEASSAVWYASAMFCTQQCWKDMSRLIIRAQRYALRCLFLHTFCLSLIYLPLPACLPFCPPCHVDLPEPAAFWLSPFPCLLMLFALRCRLLCLCYARWFVRLFHSCPDAIFFSTPAVIIYFRLMPPDDLFIFCLISISMSDYPLIICRRLFRLMPLFFLIYFLSFIFHYYYLFIIIFASFLIISISLFILSYFLFIIIYFIISLLFISFSFHYYLFFLILAYYSSSFIIFIHYSFIISSLLLLFHYYYYFRYSLFHCHIIYFFIIDISFHFHFMISFSFFIYHYFYFIYFRLLFSFIIIISLSIIIIILFYFIICYYLLFFHIIFIIISFFFLILDIYSFSLIFIFHCIISFITSFISLLYLYLFIIIIFLSFIIFIILFISFSPDYLIHYFIFYLLFIIFFIFSLFYYFFIIIIIYYFFIIFIYLLLFFLHLMPFISSYFISFMPAALPPPCPLMHLPFTFSLPFILRRFFSAYSVYRSLFPAFIRWCLMFFRPLIFLRCRLPMLLLMRRLFIYDARVLMRRKTRWKHACPPDAKHQRQNTWQRCTRVRTVRVRNMRVKCAKRKTRHDGKHAYTRNG